MLRLAGALSAIVALAGGAAEAQAPGPSDSLLIGHWVCAVKDGPPQFGEVLAQFEADRRLMMKFNYAEGTFKLSLSIYGTWKYTPSTDSYASEIISSARVGDMIKDGQPLSREAYPGGEAAILKMEQGFLDEYSTSPLNVTTLTPAKLVITDSADAKIECAH